MNIQKNYDNSNRSDYDVQVTRTYLNTLSTPARMFEVGHSQHQPTTRALGGRVVEFVCP